MTDSIVTLPERPILQAIIDASGSERARLFDDFARSKSDTMRSLARQLCRTCHLDPLRHADEVFSIVAMQFTKLINSLCENPARMDAITSFDGHLYAHSKAPVRTYGDGAQSGERPSGTTSLARRQREMARTHAALRVELGREPTPVEVVETTNARMQLKRKDYERQGMKCSVEDLQHVDNVPLLPDETDAAVWMETDTALAPHEARKFLAVLGERMRATDTRAAQVLAAWLGGLYDPAVGAPRPVAEVAKMVGMKVSEAAELIAGVQDVAAQVLLTEFGVHDMRENA